jgi:hypothetical protein
MASLRHDVVTSNELSASSEARPPLRLGVVVESLRVPGWIGAVLSEIEGSEFLELDLLLVPSETSGDRSGLQRARAGVRTLFYRAYERLDRRAFRAPYDAVGAVDLSGRFPQATTSARVEPLVDGSPTRALRDLDVLLLLGRIELDGEALSAPRFGAWRVRFAAIDPLTDGIGVPEVRDSKRACEVSVEVVGEAGGTIIDRSWTSADAISLYRTRNRAGWRAAHSLIERLADLHARGSEGIRPLGTLVRAAEVSAPRNREMLSYIGRLGSRALVRQAQSRLFREQWFVAYRPRQSDTDPSEEMSSYRLIPTPAGRSFMDPFVIERGGLHYVFFEDYSDRLGKAVISVVELDDDGNASAPRLALERDYHLSYPFVFSHGDELYMVPETSANGRIELYRATAFPDQWTFDRTLIPDLTAVDATILERDGRFWLFASAQRPGTRLSDELSLFYADSPFGPWIPHRRNPIVCDPRSARPAGRVFEQDGSLIRPSQDCARSYGRAVVFNRIDFLDEDDYRETPIGRIEPAWIGGNLGTHTYNRDARYEVVDGRRLVSRVRAWRGR